MKKRILAILLVIAMLCSMLSSMALLAGAEESSEGSSTGFVDVPDDAYYKDAVEWAVANGITAGTSPTTFGPKDACTRAQTMTFLWSAKGKPTVERENPFTDISADKYYYDAVLWAVDNGITSGMTPTTFGPKVTCTRAQVVTFLWHAMGDPVVERDNPFTDVPEDSYFHDAVLWAVENGVTAGTSETTFSPKAPCTRAQIVTFLYKALAEEEEAPDERLNEYGLAKIVEDGAILHAWCWNFNTIKAMIPQIAAAGFSAVQTSPINSIIVGENGGLQIVGQGKWYYHYQPTEYEVIGNYQLGTDEEFRQMCEVAHSYGVKVIVDQVVNHMTATESAISGKIRNEIDWGEPGEWGNPSKPWTHKSTGTNWSERDRFEETQNSLSGLIEWNTQNPRVQAYILNWLQTCVEAGADGFRYDAAKLIELPDDVSIYHPENNFASDFWPTVLQNGASFQYGEALQEGEPNHRWQDVPNVVSGYNDEDSSRLHAYQAQTFLTKDGEEKHFNTTLSFYGWRLRDAIHHGNLNADYVGDMLVPEGASADRTVTWVESHDNYINDHSYNELDEQQVIQAWAILAARKEGTPLFFSRPMNATASSPYGNNLIGPEGSHFFMDAQVVAVNFFRNEMGSAEEFVSNPTGTNDIVMIERGDKGAVIVNVRDEDTVLDNAPVQSMADGTYTDQVYGGTFTVSDGKISGSLRAGKVAVVYNSKLQGRLDFEPEITLSVPTSEFITDTLEVTISMRGVDHASYTVNEGEPAEAVNGTVVTIGEGMENDDTATLVVTGFNAEGEQVAQASATYTKRGYRGDTMIFVEDQVRINRGWGDATVYIYLWGSNGTNNGSWPGVAAELQTEGKWAGYWKYVLPFELENEAEMHVIVNNGSGGGNNQIERGDMLIHPGEIKVMNADEEWEDGSGDYHKHEWDEGVTTAEPTCTEDGSILYTCAICGNTKTEAIPALGHDWDEGQETLEPTCTADGAYTYTCTRCGETRDDPIDALGHEYDEDGVCVRCGEIDPNLGKTGFVQATVKPAVEDQVIIAVETEDGFYAFQPLDYNRNPAPGVPITVEDRVVVDPDPALIWTVDEGTNGGFSGLVFRFGGNNLRFNSNRIRLQNNLGNGIFAAVNYGDAFKLRNEALGNFLGYADGNYVIAGEAYPVYFFTWKEGPDLDTEALEAAIAEAEAVQTGNYTDESVQALQEALENAKDALDHATTQEEVDEATAALLAALEALVELEPDINLNEYGLAEEVEDGVILHVWTWKHSTVKEHIPEIVAAGYTAIQTSPIAGGGNGTQNSISRWATLYNPQTITIGNNLLGTEAEFREMVEVAHSYGLKVIVDVVINHNRGLDNAGIDWGEPGTFGDASHPWAHATRFDWYEGTLGWNEQNRLTGTLGPQVSRDLNTQNPAVQQAMKNYLISCVEAGADGFRFDAMRSVELPVEYPVAGYEDIDFSSEYLPTIIQNGASFQYGESLQGNPPSYDAWTPEYDDSGNSRLGDYQALTFDYNGEERHLKTTLSFYGQRLRESVSKGIANAAYMENMMVNKGADAAYTVTWVESHDNYVNDKSYVSMDEQKVIQAWAILAARKEGTPLYYSRPLNSTITNIYGDNDNRKPGSPSFKDPQVVAVNFFHNEMNGLAEYLSNPTGTDDVLMIERGTRGAVIVNLRGTDLVLENAPVLSMADGSYTDQVYGGAFTVEGGKISGSVKAGRVAVVYNSQVETSLQPEPSVYLLPTSKTFYSGSSSSGTVYPETMNAYPSLVNVDHGTYRLNDGEEIPIADGESILIGEDMPYGSSVTVTVTGYDAEGNVLGSASATYTKQEFTGSSVRISDTWVKNRGWERPYVYAWGADGEAFGGWPGASPVLQSDGYWYVALDDSYALSSWNIIFNNFNGDQLSDQTLGASQHKVWNENGRWVDYTGQIDPSVSEPSVSATPGTGTFDTTIDVTLSVNPLVDHAAYQLGEGPETVYTDGTVLTIGADMAKGDTVLLKLTGYGADDAILVTAEYSYTKSPYNNDTTIYIDLEMHPDWDISIYVYSGSANNGWNAVHASALPQENGYYVYLLPDNLQGLTCTVIFSNNGSDSERVEAGWTIGPDEHKVWRPDGSDTGAWEDFVPESTPGIVYVEDGYQGWDAYAVHAWNAPTAELSEGQITTTWPGVVSELQTEGEWNGYWKSVLPDEFEGLEVIKIIINNNGNGSQQDAGTMAWGETKVMTKDGEWLNPEDLPTEPELPNYPDPEGPLTWDGLSKEVGGGSILHTWCWNFNTIKEMIPSIAAAGFSAVQTSPINEIKVGDNGGLSLMSPDDGTGTGKWWWNYQPTNYNDIGNYQLGTEEEFKAMVETAHAYGVKVIVDQVINHTTSDYEAVSPDIKNRDWGTEVGNYPFSDDPTDGWRHRDVGWANSPRLNSTVGWLSGLIDWNTQNPQVQQYLLQWLQYCVEAGADGFRFDAAHHIELPTDSEDIRSDFWPIALQNGASFQYGEVLSSGLVSTYQALTFDYNEETRHFGTTNASYGSTLRNRVSGRNLGVNNITNMGTGAANSVTWVESHDNYCNEGSYNTLNDQQVIQAWAILSARKDGTPLFFSRPNNATSSNPWGDNLVGPAGNPFFMDPQVVAANYFRIDMEGLDEYLSNPGGNATLMIERGDKGAVIVNTATTDLVLEGVASHMADGSYTDQVYGGTFVVENGLLSGTVDAGSVAVVYEPTAEGRLELPPMPADITLSVADGTEFITETLSVTVGLRGIDHATYQVNDGEAQAVKNGATLVLGGDLETGSYIKLTVIGYDAADNEIHRAEATYLKKAFDGTVVYMSSTDAQVRGWSQVYVYTWGPGSNASWPGVKMELQENGFYRYALPSNLELQNGHHVIFNNGSGGGTNQFDAGDLNAGEHKVWTADRQWIYYNDSMVDLNATVFASPGDTVFTTETLAITLNVLGCDHAAYQLDDGALTPFTNGEVITVGADMDSGDVLTLKLYGYNSANEQIAASENRYTKMVYENATAIYIDPAVRPDWTNFCIYVYASDGDHGHGWPGVQQADLEEEDDLLVWVLPADLQGLTLTVIFSNGGSNQVEQGWTIGPDQQKIWRADGSANGVWEDYTPG